MRTIYELASKKKNRICLCTDGKITYPEDKAYAGDNIILFNHKNIAEVYLSTLDNKEDYFVEELYIRKI